ncbi:Polyketide cyclase / dehydrase and lipid transport [Arthrobacter sp. ok909]|uniref:SRPBCC family protein n=1 Tax=Arthrobacter sp. ok909 TaxID=1761746 RepID=UPI000881DD49|nr:SRPBCC family protein [Arthrobacter sp. ok909]SDP62547.1 Polyketide cyclase / dehydrase and lipid transport [Arthrobacter sp. ok909]
MAFAEYDVVIHRDAMSVYNYLIDPGHLPLWRDGVRSVELLSGAAGAKGAVYRQTIAGPGGRPVAADFEIVEARPGAEIQYQVIAGPARPHGGYYLSTEGPGTRVRFALKCEPKGLLARLTNPLRRRMKAEVGQLDRLKSILEHMPGAE